MNVLISCSKSVRGMSGLVKAIKNSKYMVTKVICTDRSKNELASRYAMSNNIPIEFFPSHKLLINRMDSLVAVWDGKSDDTKVLIDSVAKRGKPHTILLEE